MCLCMSQVLIKVRLFCGFVIYFKWEDTCVRQFLYWKGSGAAILVGVDLALHHGHSMLAEIVREFPENAFGVL